MYICTSMCAKTFTFLNVPMYVHVHVNVLVHVRVRGHVRRNNNFVFGELNLCFTISFRRNISFWRNISFCPDGPFVLVLPFLPPSSMSCHSYNVLSVMFPLYCTGMIVLFWLFSSDCPVLAVLFWLSCSGGPVLALLFWLSCPGCLFFGYSILTVLVCLSCFGCPVLTDLYGSCPDLAVLVSPHGIPCRKFTASSVNFFFLKHELKLAEVVPEA